MSSTVDTFGGPSTQDLGKEQGDGVVYSVSLKRVRYGSQSSDSPEGHLQWNSRKVRTLRAGTVEKLVENLAPWRETVDVSYRTCFLCTYRTFTSADIVLQLLRERYDSMEPSSCDSPKDSADKTAVQNSIISFLRLWMESYQNDFYRPPSHPLLSQLHPLTIVSPIIQRTVEYLQREFESKEALQNGSRRAGVDGVPGVIGGLCEADGPGEADVTSGPGEDGVLGRPGDCSDDSLSIVCSGNSHESIASPEVNFNLCTLDPEQFARYLTAEDAVLFQTVIPHQCLAYIREPKDPDNALSVRACIQHFNRVSFVVMATILDGPEYEERGFTIGCWIDIALQCRAIKNFSSLKAIVSGLQSSSVYRLRKSWEAVTSTKVTLFQELAELLAADDNHQMSRDLLNREGTAKYAELSPKKTSKGRNGTHGSVQGVVPYLGMFLTDLTMLNSAYKDHTEDGFVNFDKSRKLFELLAQLTLYQKSAANYKIPTHPGLVHWLNSTNTYFPKESYDLSVRLEPDNSPSHLHSPPSTLPTLSPTRIRRTLKCFFNSKGTIVSDVHPPSTLTTSPTSPGSRTLGRSLFSKQFSDISKKGSYDFTNGGFKESHRDGKKMRLRTNSLSPSIGRKFSENKLNEDHVTGNGTTARPLPGHVIRVALTHSDHCNYKCLLLAETDKANSVIKQAIAKLSIGGSPSDYSLVQLVEGKGTVPIPSHANVYYALANTNNGTEIVKATLLLVKK